MNICKFCNKKVLNTPKGFMEYNTIKYHYACVEKYGYNKFCLELLNR